MARAIRSCDANLLISHELVQLDFTVGAIKPISEGHPLISLYDGARYKYLFGGAPIQIAGNAAAAVVWPRARWTHIVKNR